MEVLVTTPHGEPIAPSVVRLRGLTEEDYYRLVPPHLKADFVRGVVIVPPPVSNRHSDLVRFLDRLLAAYAEEGDLGVVRDATLRLIPRELSRMPDLYFISRERDPGPSSKYLEHVPDFIIEVVVESSLEEALGAKREEFERWGVREYWVVDDEGRTVHAFRRGAEGFLAERAKEGRLESASVPGFWIDVGRLWSNPLPRVGDCVRRLIPPARGGSPAP